MKIIQVMPDFGLAGAEIMCENLTYELIKNGNEVVVVSLFDFHSAITERLEKAGVKIIYLDKKLGLDIFMIKKLKKIFKKENPDVIHTHRNAAQYAMPATIKLGIKHSIHTVHNIAGKENGTLSRKLNKIFFKHCGLIPVALSERIKDSIIEEYKIKAEEIPVIYNGVDISKCLPKKEYNTCGNFKILHIGRFSEQKNHVGLLQAFDLFHKKYPDTELWLMGEGEKRTEIVEYIQKNELEKNVRLLGLQSNVYPYLHDADIFTLPSNYEGMPMTLIEAMGTGLPIVATLVGGVPDMLTNNENALLVENNPETIAKGFEEYYLNEALRKEHGQKAKERSISFSAEAMAKEYESIYLL